VSTPQTSNASETGKSPANTVLAILFALIIPGGGHLFLRKYARAAIFFSSISILIVAGLMMNGTLFSLLRPNSGDGFLQLLAAVGNFGLGATHVILHWLNLGFSDITVRTNEYGTTFLIVAALLNLLIVLNAMDISLGEKE